MSNNNNRKGKAMNSNQNKGIWVDQVSLDDPFHRDQYRQDRLRVAWAMLADGLVGVLSLGHLRSCWSVSATNDLVRCTFQARRRERAEQGVTA